ncbi:LRR and CARD domains-containing protein 3) (Nucleotide-binding oligomerization domain protein 3) [Durusdinium trenchii]|uniref:LRR and CARD domains-containing protein 3 (Nucleotide-binding oligomerization domain protein 3 n=1 Tax=Durusdinium trenchii TaxID=1381693 RepID=A0ABP0JDT9_9DINO
MASFALRQTPTRVSGEALDDAGAVALAEELKGKPTVEELTISDAAFGASSATALGEAIKASKSLKVVHLTRLAREQPNPGAAIAALEALLLSPTAEEVGLFSASVGERGMVALAECLKTSAALKNLRLSRCDILHSGVTFADCDPAKKLTEALTANRTLRRLSLAGCKLGPTCGPLFAAILRENAALLELDLSENGLNGSSATALAEGLSVNRTLFALNLDDNLVDTTGAALLAEALKVNVAMRRLSLENNVIGDLGATAFAEALKTNGSVKELNLSHNNIGQNGALALAEMVEINRTLQQLVLRFNKSGYTGSKALAAALSKNEAMVALDLFQNSVPGSADLSIDDSLRRNKKKRNMRTWRALAWSVMGFVILHRDIYKPGHPGYQRAAASFQAAAAVQSHT